jgi:2,3-bisphosphoglycerate-dependent phosphoglycerate mutase
MWPLRSRPSHDVHVATLILLRHGESEWNAENLFTGWHDVDLTPKGEAEAADSGQRLLAERVLPDVVHTSLQRRAIRTADLALAACERSWIPVRRHWRLNERHYGALQGQNKAEATAEFGADQVLQWRRGYRTPPPALTLDDPRHPRHDTRYASLPPDVLPASECLADVVDRMLPYWHDAICTDLAAGHVVLVAAHGNSLRALVKHLDGISDDDIVELNIPTGVPIVYLLDEEYRPLGPGRSLGDPDEIKAKTAAVANQATPG